MKSDCEEAPQFVLACGTHPFYVPCWYVPSCDSAAWVSLLSRPDPPTIGFEFSWSAASDRSGYILRLVLGRRTDDICTQEKKRQEKSIVWCHTVWCNAHCAWRFCYYNYSVTTNKSILQKQKCGKCSKLTLSYFYFSCIFMHTGHLQRQFKLWKREIQLSMYRRQKYFCRLSLWSACSLVIGDYRLSYSSE